ncbi:hypothetical protein [Streptomyces beihaiensis]|uniref:Uncharacterized protein n=1 Tax=Streptomyces beihaiensis TaxID=2984495 RepID=A0ABT3TZ86_9ACTN|nr:hypothetical protein [Streptomyces beihaiensis]MCX3061375.1 hypothetical protein [Streptomyces beihaiensis]
MAVESGTRHDERVTGRVWTIRLDPDGRPSAGAVKLSCSRPACADQRFATAAEARRAAVGHVNAHLAHVRAGGGPRGGAWCACRAADCGWHAPGSSAGRRGAGPQPGAVRCGGPVVLSVYADRAGRLWRIAEMCARCAAATPDCRVLDTAAPAARTAPDARAAGGPAGGTAAVFSDRGPCPDADAGTDADAVGASSVGAPAAVPRARGRAAAPGAGPRPDRRRGGKIAQRIVPHDLEPDVLRLELVELGDAFRAYQQCPEPDLALLATLHDRKARAFRLWADVCGDPSLRQEADRAEKAAETTREMHEHRVGPVGGPAVERLLSRGQAAHVRDLLGHIASHAPSPEPGVHLAVLMLTLRAARCGSGNITGQDLTGWLQDDAEGVLRQLADADWLRMPSTSEEVMASRPENPTAFTVPSLLPVRPHPFTLGKNNRSRISGWAQKVVGDRKLRKKKAGPATRLLALYTAAHTRPDGRLRHAGRDGLGIEEAAAFCAVPPEDVRVHADLLVGAGWLAEADVREGRVCGQLAERVLPLGGLL